MSATLEARLATVELELAELAARVGSLQDESPQPQAVARVAPREGPARAMPETPEPVEERRPFVRRRSELDLEELLGGRVLAIVGGTAVLIGLAFFVALAVERAWIGEQARVALAFAASALLVGAGVWLGEHRRRDQASLALVGTGIAGSFLSLVAATALYHLVPLPLALAAALAVGTAATVVAVRWDSRTLAGLGIVGALAAPLLKNAGHADLASTGFLLVALAASAGVLVWRRWEWLRIVAFVLGLSQVALWVFDAEPPGLPVVAVLCAVVALELVAALGFEARKPAAGLRPSTALLVALVAVVAAALGAVALGHEAAAGGWIAGLAVAHALLGVSAIRSRRIADEIGQLLLVVAAVAADTAFALLTSGPALAIGWAASAVALGRLARRFDTENALLRLALGGQLALAAAHTLLFDAPPGSLVDGAGSIAGAAALAAVAAGAFACARLTRDETPRTKRALDAAALAGLLYLTAVCLDGTPLVLAWAAEAAALGALAQRLRDDTARFGALAFLAAASAHVLAFEAPPDALVDGAADLGAAALAVAAVAAGALRTWQAWPRDKVRGRLGLLGGAAAAALYLCSVAIVDAFQPGTGVAALGLEVGVRQEGQAVLSAFWALAGLAALAAGLRLHRRELRLGGFGLLLLATGKVFLYDLSTMESTWRVLSFVVLGLLLLAAALVYQRARRAGALPRPLAQPS